MKKEQSRTFLPWYGERYQHELDLVFPRSDGSIQPYYTVRRGFNRLIEKANVRTITFHDLRRMHILMAYRAGIPFKVLMYHTDTWSGTINIIYDYYTK